MENTFNERGVMITRNGLSAGGQVFSLRDIQESYGWATRSAQLSDNTSSFSKPQVISLEPTPTKPRSERPKM